MTIDPMGMVGEPPGTSSGNRMPMTLDRALEILGAFEEQMGRWLRKNKFSEQREALAFALNCMRYMAALGAYGDCNTCQDRQECCYVPRLGDQVRINCPFYQGEKRVSKIRTWGGSL